MIYILLACACGAIGFLMGIAIATEWGDHD
jgi:hypothetical protein